jgi:hypothetical protein
MIEGVKKHGKEIKIMVRPVDGTYIHLPTKKETTFLE